MSQSVNGWPEFDPWLASFIPSYKKLTQITAPRNADLLVFLDEHEDSIMDALFGFPACGVWGDARVWWDIPANRHGQGCNLSFADGHAERWRWRVPKVVRVRLVAQAVAGLVATPAEQLWLMYGPAVLGWSSPAADACAEPSPTCPCRRRGGRSFGCRATSPPKNAVRRSKTASVLPHTRRTCTGLTLSRATLHLRRLSTPFAS